MKENLEKVNCWPAICGTAKRLRAAAYKFGSENARS
jgi:hypothetical protein